MSWKGKALVPWEPDLKRFPLDSQALQLLVGFSGEDPLEVILAVDGEIGKNETLPKAANPLML